MKRRPPLFLLALASLVGVGCSSVRVEGADGFTIRSEVWLVLTQGSSTTHSLVASSVTGYCDKFAAAEQARIDATERHQERLDADGPFCESQDLFYDDLADAYGELVKKGSRTMTITLDRADVGETLEARTNPAAGSYAQMGAGNDGSFAAQLIYYNGPYYMEQADAHACLSPDEVDETNFNEFLQAADDNSALDLRDVWSLTGGTLEVEEKGGDKRSLVIEGDLLEGTTTIGGLESSFDAKRCEVEVSGEG